MASVTPVELVRRLRKLERELDRPVVNAFRRGLTYARGLAVASLQTRGVGRRLFGRKASGARKLVTVTRVRRIGGTIVGGLKAKGLAALQEVGGRTAEHVITPRRADRLVFPVRGRIVATKRVQHPGSRMPRMPFLESALDRAMPRVQRDLERALQEKIRTTVG